jgi:hypothetical protein
MFEGGSTFCGYKSQDPSRTKRTLPKNNDDFLKFGKIKSNRCGGNEIAKNGIPVKKILN